jgi:ankyrin repeat protein
VAQLLIEKGADINARTISGGRKPLHWAVDHQRELIVELLIQSVADPKVEDM